MVRLTCWLFPALLALPFTLAVRPENEPHQAALNAAKPGLLDANRDFDGKEEWIPPYPGSTVTSWIGAKIPKFCADIAQERWNQSDPSSRSNCALNEVEVNEVEYDDCTGVKYLMCRCLDAPANKTTMAQNYGRLSPAVRNVVSHLMAVDRSQLPGQVGTTTSFVVHPPRCCSGASAACHAFWLRSFLLVADMQVFDRGVVTRILDMSS